MLFRNLLAPFARGLAPKGWVVPLILGGLSAAQFITGRRDQGRYRREVDAAREARGNLFAAVGPRVAGLEGIPTSILQAAGRGLPPAPPPTTNLFQSAMQIAGAYAANRQAGGTNQPAEGGEIQTDAPPVQPTTDVMPPPQAQMGGPPASDQDPAAAAEQAQAQAGAGQQPQAAMGAMTEDQAASTPAATRDLFTPEQMFAMG